MSKKKEDITRDSRISSEIKRLNVIFKNIETNTQKSITSLIQNVAFMTITLEDLQKSINENGAISEYKNGENQYGTKKSPEVEIYNTMIKNQMSALKQLTDLLPKSGPIESDGFEDFVNDR